MSYRSYIGLEIHIHLLTRSKAFCSCPAHFGDQPNTNVCPICLGYPGALPALNGEAMAMGYRVARALDCELAPTTIFERKNYFYPDMPKNYQISQFAAPLGRGGSMEFEVDGVAHRVAMRECHFEEDAGKMIHAGDSTLIDYNRAGTSLLEIVSEPEMSVGAEAEAFLQAFRRMVRYLGVCDGNMEEGSLRCDANVSVNEEGKGLGVKVEIKNMNSFRFVRKALDYEIRRQKRALEEGGRLVQETRLWNENRDVTETMRSKESSKDYRFFPEPDLPPFRPDRAFLDAVEASVIELPLARKRRFTQSLGLDPERAEEMTEELALAEYFEAAVAAGAEPQAAAAWISSEVKGQLNARGMSIEAAPLGPARLASILELLSSRTINSKVAKLALRAVFDEDRDPAQIVAERGWEQITAAAELALFAESAVSRQGEAVGRVRSGDEKSFERLVGEAMRESGGRAEPALLRNALRTALAASTERTRP